MRHVPSMDHVTPVAINDPWARNSRRAFVWTTKDGRKIPIRFITDNHLINIIKFVRRRMEEELENQKRFIEGLWLMFDNEDLDTVYDYWQRASICDEDMPEWWLWMVKEAYARGLAGHFFDPGAAIQGQIPQQRRLT